MAQATTKHFTLKTLSEEPEHIRVWEGPINGVNIKIILNPTDQRVPRFIVSSPDAQIFGLHFHQMPRAYQIAYNDAMSILGQLAIERMQASLVNYRIEGNLHCSSAHPEPLHPHVHVLFRYPSGKIIIDNYESMDPSFGKDYPLADGKKLISIEICKSISTMVGQLFVECIENNPIFNK
jgi:hypothetical protein